MALRAFVRGPPAGRGRSARNCLRRPSAYAIIALEQPSETAEDRTLFMSAPAGLRGGGVNASRQPAEGQRLKPDSTGASECGKEQSFATEERGLDLANELNVIIDCRLKRDNT